MRKFRALVTVLTDTEVTISLDTPDGFIVTRENYELARYVFDQALLMYYMKKDAESLLNIVVTGRTFTDNHNPIGNTFEEFMTSIEYIFRL